MHVRRSARRRILGWAAATAATVAATPAVAVAGGGAARASSAAAASGASSGPASASPASHSGVPVLGATIDLPGVTLLDGREIAPGYWRGKVLVVELWATWCPFCAKQNPTIDRLHRAHVDRGLEVLGLSIDRDPELVRRYMRERGYAFHAAMFDDRWSSALGRPRGLPVVWVIGHEGRLEQVEIGEMFPEDVERLARWRLA